MNISWINISSSELLFWVGIVFMAVSVLLAVVFMTVFRITGCRLKRRLEQEYGKPER